MGILDRLSTIFAAPKEPSKPAVDTLFGEQAIERFTTLLFQLADPDEILRKAGLNRTELRKLEYDDEIYTALETRHASLIATPWRLEPYDATAKLVEQWLKPHLPALLDASFNATLYGYSVSEAIYRRDGKVIVFDRIVEKPFEWFAPARDGKLHWMQVGSAIGVEVDTQFKFFLCRSRPTYQNPRGVALLSRLYWPWFMRSAGWRFFARFIERNAAPLLVGKTAGDKAAFAAMLARAVQSGSLAVDSNDSAEAVTTNNRGEAFDMFHERVDKRIQKVVLGQTLTTDVGRNGGAYAAAKVHDTVRMDRRQIDIARATELVQHAINALVALNMPTKTAPAFVMEAGRDIQMERAERDAKLVTSKIIKLTPKYILDRYDFEEGDFEMPAEPDPEAAAPVPGEKQFAASRRPKFTADQQALEDLGTEAILRAGQPIPVAEMRAAIEGAESPAEMLERLLALVDPENPGRFGATLENALFAADVMGYAHGAQETDDR